MFGVAMAMAGVPAGLQRSEGGGVALLHSRLVEIARPTALDFGPDGRLYVAQVDGTIRAFTVVKDAPGRYRTTATETIDLVRDIPNHDRGGRARPDLRNRLVTGVLVEGTAERPVVWVTSSDPRLGDKGETDLGIDPESGTLSRLVREGGRWAREDLVIGLPRSAEDHATHGIARLGPHLLVSQGGNTNMGAPSRSFLGFPETPLSAALLRIDPERLPVDVRQPQEAVTLYATGFRNAYDVAVTRAGEVFTIDNGPNHTWGGPPADCTNTPVEGGATSPDTLHRVREGAFHGHPNPSRQECTFVPPDARPTRVTLFPSSTNGLTEATAGPLSGRLLTVSFVGELLAVNPSSGHTDVLATGFGAWPVDVVTQGPDEPFPGTIWVAAHLQERIQVFEPVPR